MKKILIVDYDQSSLASLQGVLAGQGYSVVTAADGQAGWDKYNKESPDLVLMEAMLPKVHGFELCQRITSERNSQATVFIMTGVYKDRVYRTEALRTYGAAEYFEKPLRMAELLASVEAVLGKPVPVPEDDAAAAEPQAHAPVREREMRAEAAPAEPRKRERARSDDSMFALPEDLDRMAREIPKMRKLVPAAHEPSVEPRLEALADDLLRSVIVESKTPKASAPKSAGGNGNGNGNGNGKAEIDQFLASALAGLELDKEKIKVPKTAPLPPPPAPAVKEAPLPTPPLVVAKETKPAPAPAPHRTPAPEPIIAPPAPADMKNTLTPGDPGSDLSPFFTPEKHKPAAPVEKPKVQPVAAPPVPAPAPKPAKPVEKTAKAAAPAVEHPRPAPAPPKPEPPPPAPRAREIVKKEIQPTMSGDIFQDIHETTTEKRSGFPKIVAVGIGVVALAAAGFLFLRPKHRAPAPVPVQETTQTLTQTNTPVQTVEEAPPPVAKPAPAKQKVQPKAKPVEPEPSGADAILPNMTAAAAPPLVSGQSSPGPGNGQTGSPSNQAQADAQQAKTEEAPPPVNTEAAQGSDAGAGTAGATPIVPPVNEGDLVELSAVTEPPKLIKSADPVYPQTAQRLGVGGSITVNALIDEKGNVIDTGILKGIKDDKGLGRAAETAVKKWKFQPARKNGVAVKVWKSFVIAFKADANPANRTE